MLTLADYVRLNARRSPDRDALVDDRGRLTHLELSQRATALARGLIGRGVAPGDRVGVLSANSNFAIETLLGIAVAGAVYVPFNWRWADAELSHGIEMTAPKIILVESDFAENFAAAQPAAEALGATVFHQGDDYESLLDPGDAPTVALKAEDPLCILFTGGTTGQPKGVVLSHLNAINNAVNEIADCGLGQAPYNTGMNITPLFHSAALLCVCIPNYITGGTNVMMRKFDEQLFGELVEREKVNSTFIIPNMIRRLLASGVLDRPGVEQHLKQLHSGGGLLRIPDKQAVLSKLPALQLFFRYGLTEGGPMVSRLLPEDVLNPALDGSIGKEYTFTEVQVQDVSGNEVPPGELGEICVRGPSVMIGYFDQPEATAESLRDGWLHTGDLGIRDENGYLFFQDRAKDMIKTGGENVYAAEIEQWLYAHPAVMECGILGTPSEEWDEEVRAVIALREGQTITEEDLRSYLREHLAGYKIPKMFMFVQHEQMPVNPSGKIVKSRLRQLTGW